MVLTEFIDGAPAHDFLIWLESWKREDTLTIALIYGNRGSSVNMGGRSVPMTRSNSSCARSRISGFDRIPINILFNCILVVSLPASIIAPLQ
jgi:hypothetical protein